MFITHSSGVSYVSLSSWTSRLEDELKTASQSGSTFRLDVFLEGLQSLIEHPIQVKGDLTQSPQNSPHIASALSFKDPEIGYFLLTAVSGQPYATILDLPDSELLSPDTPSAYYNEALAPNLSSSLTGVVPQYETRAPYKPSSAFWMNSTLPNFLRDTVPQRERHLVTEEIKLSARSLGLMQQAHRILSQETNDLGAAAADLFTRSERLVRELREQITRVVLIRDRVELVVGGGVADGEDGEKEGAERVEERLQNARRRQEELSERYEALRRKVGSLGGKELSAKEKMWMKEVENVDETLTPLREEGDGTDGEAEGPGTGLSDRFEEVKRLAQDLVARGREVGENTSDDPAATGESDEAQANGSNGVRIAPSFRKAKVMEVEKMLERESALVDATMEKLDRLKLQPL